MYALKEMEVQAWHPWMKLAFLSIAHFHTVQLSESACWLLTQQLVPPAQAQESHPTHLCCSGEEEAREPNRTIQERHLGSL